MFKAAEHFKCPPNAQHAIEIKTGLRVWVLTGTLAGLLGLAAGAAADLQPGAHYYSTVAPPASFKGPQPQELLLARNDTEPRPVEPADAKKTAAAADQPVEQEHQKASNPAPDPVSRPAPGPAASPPPAAAAREAPSAAREAAGPATRLATAPIVPPSRTRPREATAADTPPAASAAPDPITLAKQVIAQCRERFAQVHDYTCMFHKRERIDGRLTPYHVMAMKVRTHPHSIYVKLLQPNAGREAIYVSGKHNGHVLAHDVGIGKVLAGTLVLDPRGSRAMEDNRHPITEAGIGHLIETVYERWNAELRPGESLITIHPTAHVGNRPCLVIQSDHPQRKSNFMFYSVKLYIDRELGLPIRFEAYDWPRQQGTAPELLEEYTYSNLRLNVGLREHDFEPRNAQYSFGRF